MEVLVCRCSCLSLKTILVIPNRGLRDVCRWLPVPGPQQPLHEPLGSPGLYLPKKIRLLLGHIYSKYICQTYVYIYLPKLYVSQIYVFAFP